MLLNLWKKIANIGIHPDTPDNEVRRIRLLNKVTVLGMSTIVTYMIIFALIKLWEPFVLDIIGLILFLPALIANKLKKYETGRLLFILCSNIVVSLFCWIFGDHFWTHLLFINTSSIGILLFNKRQKAAIAFLVAGLFFGICLYTFENHVPIVPPTESLIPPPIFKILSVITVGAITYLSIAHLKEETDKYETIIEKINDNLSHQNEKLNQQTEEIQAQSDQLSLQNKKMQEVNSKLKEKSTEITDSLKYASQIQNAILGSTHNILKNFKNGFILFKPKDIVSGDFYWFAQVEDTHIVIAADCTGHGVPGAFMTVMGNDLLNDIIIRDKIIEPHKILHAIDQKIIQTLKKNDPDNQRNDGMDMSILCINHNAKTIHFAGANNPVYSVHDHQVFVRKGSPFPIGSTQYQGEKHFESHKLVYQEGYKYYLFSDGFQDQFGGPHGKKFMVKKFRELILNSSHLSMLDQSAQMELELMNWMKLEPQTDDILVIGIEI